MKTLLPFLFLVCCLSFLQAQKKRQAPPPTQAESVIQPDSAYFSALTWRNIGPWRGGRSCAVTGVPGKPNLFYFGSTGGGVWRTQDGGQSWQNITDGYFGGSIGAVAVSESDPNVIYVGGGEKTLRGNMSFGYGVWKSEDAGKSWQPAGLPQSRHISRLRIHPRNPDLVYAAVIGDAFKSSPERGVYRSRDGGKNWERILHVNDDAGAVDLLLDPGNPRVLYASLWRVRRTPYSFSSGGEGSGLWKSTDGGNTWQELSGKAGMPKGPTGIIGVAVSPTQPDRVWAMIEAKEGGLFRSDDGGKSWTRINSERSLRQRAWYYTRVYADPADPEGVYVMNVNFLKSTDGGRSFKTYQTPHGDHHDLWIAPEDPQRMIVGDDGGAQVSFDGGENWSSYHNQPTAQFYRLTTDNHFPYRIYTAQQDNSTIRILHRSDEYSIGERDWEETAGGESAHLAVDPADNDIVYGGSYGGFLTRMNHRTGEQQAINVWPDNPIGYGAEGMKYRFQWNFPISFSPHDPTRLYACSNHLHASQDGGRSWKLVSPDLTRNDSSKLGSSGGPITQDNTGVEYYCTIFAACESPYEKGLIWTGSDDGLIHLSRDGGESWKNVTPPASIMPEWIMINSLAPDPFTPGGLYVAATMYKHGDYQPYLFKTRDYGQSWTKIVNGIAPEHFSRVLRADPVRKGLLYCGTETGMYISFDDGAHWQSFQQNLPIVPITDLHIKQNNLIASTQGRSLWIIDDLTPLHQLNDAVKAAPVHLYKPADSYRMPGGQNPRARSEGMNHPGGAGFYIHFNESPDTTRALRLCILTPAGDTIRVFDAKAKEARDKLRLRKGMNTFRWDMRYPGAKTFEGMILWWGQTQGPRALPGEYIARLTYGEQQQEQRFRILPDPRSSASPEDLKTQFDFLMQNRDKLSETHEAIIAIRDLRKQLDALSDRSKGDESLKPILADIKRIDSVATAVEKALYQTQNRSGQDPLNYPIRLNNKLAHVAALASVGDNRPTAQSLAFQLEVAGRIDAQLAIWKQLKQTEIPALNRRVRELQTDAIRVKE